MQKILSMFLFVMITMAILTGKAQAEESLSLPTIPLWEGVVPGSEQFEGEEVYHARENSTVQNRWLTGTSKPTLTVYQPSAELASGAAVVVCAGGGYSGLAIDKEGHEIAKWFSEQGLVGVVVTYRCGGGVHRHPVPLSDAHQAIRMVRSHAEEWKINPAKVGIIGFSAGGHLAASAATHGEMDVRPNFAALIYPVISMRKGAVHGGSRLNLLGDSPDEELVAFMSADEQVDEKTPPLFLVHSIDDPAVPVENSQQIYDACRKHGVAVELHVYPSGGHGYGMRAAEGAPAWNVALAAWLKSNGFSKTAE